MKASIMIVGYNSLILEALHHVFEHKGYGTSIEKGDFRNVLNSIEATNPEIVIWDDAFVLNYFQLILEKSYSSDGDLNSVLILNSNMLHYMAKGLLHGVRGFLHRTSSMNDVENCLKDVLKGRVFISPQLGGCQDMVYENGLPKFQKRGLTKRERTILTLIAQNKSSREIAKLLHISFRTVQNHRHNMCKKLGLTGRNMLYKFALLH